MKSMSVSRRTLLTGTVALGTVGLLAACGGSSRNDYRGPVSCLRRLEGKGWR